MSKKSNDQDGLSTLPETLRDPKFEGLRNLLLQCGKFGPKSDLPFHEIVKYFDGMKEKVRGEYEPFCLEWYRFLKKSCNDHFYETAPACYPKGRTTQDAYLAVKIAIVACCSETEIKRVLKESGSSFIDEEVEPILRSRRPAWLSKFLVWIAQAPDLMDVSANDYWQIYRRFVKEKIISPMNDDVWFKLMIECMTFETCNDISSVPISLYDQLKDDPGLIETDIWRLFEFETFPKNWNFTTWDSIFHNYFIEKRKGEDWKGTLCTLIEEGTIPKKRVLDGCFKSLARPFSDHESKWYVGLLELMINRGVINIEEQVKDARFLALLDNPNPSPRVLGLKILEQLVKTKLITDKDVLRYIPAIFLEPVKGKAKKAVMLLDKIAKTNEKMRPEVCRIAVDGLRHEATEIQQAALDLLLKYDGFADPKITEAVTQLAPSLATSVVRQIPWIPKELPLLEENPGKSCKPSSKVESPKKDYIALFKNLIDSNPPVSIAATDRFIQTVADDVFDIPQAIEAAVDVIGFKAFKVSRWIKPFLIVAEQSGRHAEAIQELLEGIIPHIEKKSLSGFLEALVETSAILNRPVQSESCREFLQSLSGSGKAAKLAKKLLEL